MPVYERQVNTAPLPSVRYSPNADPMAFGVGTAKAQAGLGQAMGDVAELLHRRAMEMQEELNQTKVFDALSKFTEEQRNLLYDQQTGVFTKKGLDANGIYKQSEQKLQELANKYMAGLDNDRQRELFKAKVFPRIDSALYDVSAYEARELRTAKIEKAQADADLIVDTMALATTDKAFEEQKTALYDALWTVYGVYGESVVKQEAAERISKAHVARLENILAQDPEAAKAYLDKYRSEFDPNTWSKYNLHITDKIQDTQIKVEAKALLDQYGSVEAALAAVQNKGGIDESKLVFSSADNPNWRDVSKKTRAGTVQIWDQLKAMGLSPQITSGKRNGDGRSWHDSGDAVDIYLADENGNRLSADDPRVAKVIDVAKAIGWQEVLYHDAGSGLHLHLGDYRGDYGGGQRVSKEYLLKLEQQLRIEYLRRRQMQAQAEHDELIRVQNALAGVTDIAEKADIIRNSGLQPYQKSNLLAGIEKAAREAESIPARAQLNRLIANGTLTQQDVENYAQYLTPEQYLRYSDEAYKIERKITDQESNVADKKWQEYLDINGPYKGSSRSDKQKNDLLIVEIKDRLDKEGVKGAARYERALELIETERKNKKQILFFTAQNNAEKQRLINAFGYNVVSLAEIGFKRIGWNGDWRQVNQFLSQIGRDIESGDAFAQEALDLLVRTKTGINPQTYADAYATVRGSRYSREHKLNESLSQPLFTANSAAGDNDNSDDSGILYLDY